MSKEIWIDAVDVEMQRLIDLGIDEAKAYDMASSRGDALFADRYADMIDTAYQRYKDNSYE